MKKSILKIAFVIAVVAISSYYNVLNSRSETELSDLLMDNVEALAQGENDRKYAYREEKVLEIWDKNSNMYVKSIYIYCSGEGGIKC